MRNVVIDLGNLEYLYSDTINAFIASNRHMLEVSGRIAILTEHPKVQDILKRAGLDNIMRIYRSEAEMIADSKEILRQTSSYRIEELQKISIAPTANSNHQATTPPPAESTADSNQSAPRTEFDDFKTEMGNRLGSKLDNNEVPQLQLGAQQPASPAATFAPPAPGSYPAFNPPGFPSSPAPESAPDSQPGFVTPQPAPAFNAFPSSSPAFATTQPQGFGQGNSPAPGQFDYPTVQLPIGAFGGVTNQGLALPQGSAAQGFSTTEPPESLLADPRQRKPSQERMRSPSARKQQGRRVGGRELPDVDDNTQNILGNFGDEAPPSETAPESFQNQDSPISSPNSLVEEKRSSAKFAAILVALLLIVGGVFWFVSRSGPDETEELDVPAAAASEPTLEPMQPQATPGIQEPAEVKPETEEPMATQPPMGDGSKPTLGEPEQPKATTKPAPQQTKPDPSQIAMNTKPAPEPTKNPIRPPVSKKPARTPLVEKPTRAQEKSEDSPAPTPASTSGKLRITSNPPGAEVLVNFSKKGTTPVEIGLLNNSNKIIIRLNGYQRFEVTLPKNHPEKELTVDLEREETTIAETKPTPEPARPEPRAEPKVEPTPEPEEHQEPIARQPERQPEPAAISKPKIESGPQPGSGPIGVIFLSSSPARADIIIDGKNTGKKTPAKLELPSGSHRIEMIKSGQRSSVDQQVNEGKNKALHLTLQ